MSERALSDLELQNLRAAASRWFHEFTSGWPGPGQEHAPSIREQLIAIEAWIQSARQQRGELGCPFQAHNCCPLLDSECQEAGTCLVER